MVGGYEAKRVVGIDIFNGTEEELEFSTSGDGTRLAGMLIKDYPTLIRMEAR